MQDGSTRNDNFEDEWAITQMEVTQLTFVDRRKFASDEQDTSYTDY